MLAVAIIAPRVGHSTALDTCVKHISVNRDGFQTEGIAVSTPVLNRGVTDSQNVSISVQHITCDHRFNRGLSPTGLKEMSRDLRARVVLDVKSVESLSNNVVRASVPLVESLEQQDMQQSARSSAQSRSLALARSSLQQSLDISEASAVGPKFQRSVTHVAKSASARPVSVVDYEAEAYWHAYKKY